MPETDLHQLVTDAQDFLAWLRTQDPPSPLATMLDRQISVIIDRWAQCLETFIKDQEAPLTLAVFLAAHLFAAGVMQALQEEVTKNLALFRDTRTPLS